MGQDHSAELLADGQISFQGQTYRLPSSAGIAVKEAVRGPGIRDPICATDGWAFWRATDAKPATPRSRSSANAPQPTRSPDGPISLHRIDMSRGRERT
ncbi:MAG TPA: hypothetical protein VEL76_21655 [Gemmataceae bacterium]|nr:hypothetical protein [Gemmataceae bacterium]